MRFDPKNALLLAACLFTLNASAQTYPDKPVKLMLGSELGGSIDTSARLIGNALSIKWGQPVVIENRPGASQMIGAAAAAKSAPDGYTLFMASSVVYTINPFVFAKLPYDPDKSFTHIVLVSQSPLALISSPKAPFDSVDTLIKYGRAYPDVMSWGSPGKGTINHISGELLSAEGKFKAVHIPYKGAVAAANAVVAGDIPYAVTSMVQAVPFSQSGKVRLLAVTSARRTSLAPNIPTIAELGLPGFDASVVGMISAPAGTPKTIVDKISADVNEVLRQPAMREQLASLGADPMGSTPEEVNVHVATLRAKVQRMFEDKIITAE